MPYQPRISIIIPTHNRLSTLERTLNSIREQTFQDFECLIIDDFSSEEAIVLKEKYDERYLFFRNEENLGVSRTRLEGLKRIRGNFFTQLDDDNIFYPWTLERMMYYNCKNQNIAGISGLYIFHDGFRVRVGRNEMVLSPEEYANGRYASCDMVPVLRKEIANEWLSRFSGYRSFDGHLWITYHMKHSHMYVDEPWGEYLEDGVNRLTKQGHSSSYKDLELFAIESRESIGEKKCKPLDEFLMAQLLRHKRTKRKNLYLYQNWLNERGITWWKIIAWGALKKFKKLKLIRKLNNRLLL